MKQRIRAALEKAEAKRERTIVLTEQERFLVAHMMRAALKGCTNPAAIEILNSALRKLDEAGKVRRSA